MSRSSTAKEEIVNFLKSGEAGQTTDLNLDQLKRAAQSLFTANGLDCPVGFQRIGDTTILTNREKLANGNGHLNGNQA